MKARIFKTIMVVLFAIPLVAVAQQPVLQHYRPLSQDGLSIFEAPKTDAEFTGFKVRLGGAFSQQFQMLDHENQYTLDYVSTDPMDKSMMLVEIQNGFNLATANFNIDVQLDDGIRMELVTYLSARHHNEAWVKGGYIQFDKLPLGVEAIDNFMKYTTIKIGHMEVNYGDGHFRRSDNGNALFNPFVGNYIMDAFDTQIGGEVYFRNKGLIGMIGISEGEIKGDVSAKGEENGGAAFYGKLGYDNQINEDFRLRLTTSIYATEDLNATNHIHNGDRAGSRYFYVTEPQEFYYWRTGSMTKTSAVNRPNSGRYSPGFNNKVTAIMINPFVKFQGVEFFGMYEMAKGASLDRSTGELGTERSVNQMSGEVIYRFLEGEKLFAGARYNKVFGELIPGEEDLSISRFQIGAGWFLTKNVLAKVEYVNQNYVDYPIGDFFENASFNGLMFEAVIGF